MEPPSQRLQHRQGAYPEKVTPAPRENDPKSQTEQSSSAACWERLASTGAAVIGVVVLGLLLVTLGLVAIVRGQKKRNFRMSVSEVRRRAVAVLRRFTAIVFGLLLVLQAGLVFFPIRSQWPPPKRPSPPPKTRAVVCAAPTLRWSSTSPTPCSASDVQNLKEATTRDGHQFGWCAVQRRRLYVWYRGSGLWPPRICRPLPWPMKKGPKRYC